MSKREYDLWKLDYSKAKLPNNISNIIVAMAVMLYAARRLHGEKLITGLDLRMIFDDDSILLEMNKTNIS